MSGHHRWPPPRKGKNMMRFLTPDDEEFVGDSYSDIVAKMADEKMTEPRSNASYRVAAARRASAVYLVDIDTTSDQAFIESLEAANLLRREEGA